MKVTILGRGGPFPEPGGACSSYLVENGNVSIVMDLGSGSLSRLFQIKPHVNVNAILLSHLHSDHMADMLVLRYALQQFRERGIETPMPLTVIAPDKPDNEFRELASSGVFDLIPAREGMRVRFDEITVTLFKAAHPVPAYSFDVECRGRRLFYTGDTGMHAKLLENCMGAHVLLADTCFLNREKTTEAAPHLTAGEAGKLASDAGAQQLICTHLWGGGGTEDAVLAEASEHFNDVLIAEEMHEYQI